MHYFTAQYYSTPHYSTPHYSTPHYTTRRPVRSGIVRAVMACLCLGATLAAAAQTDAQFSQYYEARTLYNPAAAGLTDYLRLRGGVRAQWVGIDNAPLSIAGSGDIPLKVLGKRIGLGATVNTEKMGLFNSLNVNAQVAYTMKKFGGNLSIGLGVGMYDQRFRGSEVFIPDNDDYHQSSDDAIPTRDIHGTALDLGFGLWYSRPRFWVGLSGTHLTSPTVTMKSEGTETTDQAVNYEFTADRTFYLMAGGNIPLKNTLFEVMPSALVKSNINFTTWEATMRAKYNNFLLFGVGYRWKDAVYATIGIEMKDFYIGYTYDYSTSAIAKATSGSHEVWIGYSMKIDMSDKNNHKHKSIRIM